MSVRRTALVGVCAGALACAGLWAAFRGVPAAGEDEALAVAVASAAPTRSGQPVPTVAEGIVTQPGADRSRWLSGVLAGLISGAVDGRYSVSSTPGRLARDPSRAEGEEVREVVAHTFRDAGGKPVSTVVVDPDSHKVLSVLGGAGTALPDGGTLGDSGTLTFDIAPDGRIIVSVAPGPPTRG